MRKYSGSGPKAAIQHSAMLHASRPHLLHSIVCIAHLLGKVSENVVMYMYTCTAVHITHSERQYSARQSQLYDCSTATVPFLSAVI